MHALLWTRLGRGIISFATECQLKLESGARAQVRTDICYDYGRSLTEAYQGTKTSKYIPYAKLDVFLGVHPMQGNFAELYCGVGL